MNNYCCYVRCR